MVDFISFINSTLGNLNFLLVAETISLFIKIYISMSLVIHGLKSGKFNKQLQLLLVILIGAMLSNVSWIFKVIRTNFIPELDVRFYIFLIRLAWVFSVIQ